MKNIWRLFVGDLKRMGGNTITVIIILGLVTLPSLFSWFNMLACWNVFENTGHLTVAVANSDEGYESDLVPIKVNIGERVVAALRANDQLDWVFTDEADAIEGTRAGRYYAAVVIPGNFSSRMMTFYQDDSEAALLTYYSNEKKSAIAPKVTDQGADAISNQVNQVFTETLSEVALALASGLGDLVDDADAEGSIAQLSEHLQRLATELSRTSDTLRLYGATIETTQSLVSDSATLLQQTREAAETVAQAAKDAIVAADATAAALEEAAQGLTGTIDACVAAFQNVPGSVSNAFGTADNLSADSAAILRDNAATAANLADSLSGDAANLRALEALLPAETAKAIENAALQLDSMAEQQVEVRDSLNAAADAIEAENADQQQMRGEVEAMLEQSMQAISDARVEFDSNLKPTIEELASTLEHAAGTLRNTGGQLEGIGGNMSGTAGSINDQLGGLHADLAAAADKLDASAADVSNLSSEIQEAVEAGDSVELQRIIGSDPEALANVLSAPVALERTAIYPADSFGSAMSPLYTSLALWIGCLLIMVTLRPHPTRRIEEELDNPKSYQLFIGRFGVVAVISLMQSTMLCLGNLFFLGVQANEPLLYFVCFWLSGLAFAAIIYSLVAIFANLGKAIAVLLLILQVSGGGGSFPLDILPPFFQNVSPYLPVSHVVDAMRAAMFGVYANDFWVQIGIVVLFAVPLLLMGILFRKPLMKLTDNFIQKVEKSKLM